MDFISEWPLLVLLVIAAADTEAGILTAVLFASAKVTGPCEAAASAALGSLLTGSLLFLYGLRGEPRQLCNSRAAPSDDKILFWLGKYGLFGTAVLLRAALSWRLSGPAAFARLTADKTGAGAAFAAAVLIWTAGWTFFLIPPALLTVEELSALNKVRLSLPGFTLLAVIAATVLRIVLIRIYERFREHK